MIGMLDGNSYPNRNRIDGEAEAFARVPLIYRAIRLRCNALTRVPVYVYPLGGDEPMDEYPFEDTLPLNDLLWKSEAALLLKGGAFIIKLMTEMGRETGEIALANPFTMEIKESNGVLTYVQQVGKKRTVYTEDEVVFIREFNPTDDVGWGTAAASVAMGSSQLQHYMTRFASQFFEHGAMPVL